MELQKLLYSQLDHKVDFQMYVSKLRLFMCE